MASRTTYYRFLPIDDKKFISKIREVFHGDKKLQPVSMQKFKKVEDLEKYVTQFDSDMRTFSVYLTKYNENENIEGKFRKLTNFN